MTLNNPEIKKNIESIQKRILDACLRAGRDPKTVRLIAVSKTIPIDLIKISYECGIRDFGENYVQEMLKKVPELPEDIRWHFIGHLQSNKIKYLVNTAYMIHTVYKAEHLFEIEKRGEKAGKIVDVLIEINIGEEQTKSGTSVDKVEEIVRQSLEFKWLKVKGLMCIPPPLEAQETRKFFKNLRFIKDCINNNIGREVLTELSMGMSSDFEIAIEEGATMIRIGTAIFGERQRGGIK